MRVVRCLLLVAAVLSIIAVADPAAAQFSIGGDPRVDPNDFRITTFASGLNFPNGLARLSDGSILVATSNPNGNGAYWFSSGELLRFTDTNNDGIADGPGQLMSSDPVGVWTGLAVTGNMVFIMSAKDGANRIIVLKMNNGPALPYDFVGTLNFTFPVGWEHKAYAMTTRPAPGAPAGTWELYFNVGSSANDDQSTDTVGLGGLLTAPPMQGGSIYRVTVTEVGLGATVSGLVRIAAGLRNAAGMAFHPTTGDLYFEDNGIDVGFHGKFSAPPSGNEENPLVFWDLGTGKYFHFIESFQLGHGDQLLSTDDSLFIADMASDGSVDTNGGTGFIYQIKRVTNGGMSATFTSPGEGGTVIGAVPVGMSESGGTGTISWTVQLDGGAPPIFSTSGMASTATFNWDTSGVAPGAHTLTLVAQDTAGHTANATLHVVVAGPLTASFTTPNEGATVNGSVPVGMS